MKGSPDLFAIVTQPFYVAIPKTAKDAFMTAVEEARAVPMFRKVGKDKHLWEQPITMFVRDLMKCLVDAMPILVLWR
jgi:hypothetical protein